MIDPIMKDYPEFCYECGKLIPHDAPEFSKLVDLDPGSPEVGPDPDICEVAVCGMCFLEGVTREVKGGA